MVGEVEGGGGGQDLHLLVQVLATFPASSKLPILQPRKLRPRHAWDPGRSPLSLLAADNACLLAPQVCRDLLKLVSVYQHV